MSRYRGVERFCRYRTPVALMLDKVFGPAPEPISVENFRLARNAVENVLAAPAFDVQLKVNKSTGPAPHGATIDAFELSSFPSIDRPFHECSFWLDYGDEGSEFINIDPSRPFGRNANISPGMYGGHVYETAGTYTVKCYVYHHPTTKFGYAEATITTLDADVYFSGRTVCYSEAGDFTGAPAGSSNQTTYAGVVSALGAISGDKRLLIKAGETVEWAQTTGGGNAEKYYGRFGEGANPILELPSNLDTEAFYMNGGGSGGSNATFYGLNIKGNYNPIDGTGENWDANGIYLTNWKDFTLWRCDISGVSLPFYWAAGANNSGALISDCNVTDWKDLGVFGNSPCYNLIIIGNSIKQNPLAVSGGAGKVEPEYNAVGDGVRTVFNYGIVTDDKTLNIAVFLRNIATDEVTEQVEGVDFTFTGTTDVTFSVAPTSGQSVYIYYRRWADHGPIRIAENMAGCYVMNDMASYTGWSSNGESHQPNIRDSSQASLGTKSFISLNWLKGGQSILSVSPQNDETRQYARDAVVDCNYFEGTDATEEFIVCNAAGVTIRNNIGIQPDVAGFFRDFRSMVTIGKTSGTESDIADLPIRIFNNSLICLVSTANGAIDTNVVLNNASGFYTNVDFGNSLHYHPDRPEPLPDYLPLDAGNYYRPEDGSAAIDAGTETELVWDDFSGELIEGSYSLGAFDGAAPPVPVESFTDDFDRANESLNANASWIYIETSGDNNIQVVSNRLETFLSNATASAYADFPVDADCYVKADIETLDQANCSLIARNTSGSFYALAFSTIGTTSGKYRLITQRRVGGTITGITTSAEFDLPAFPAAMRFEVEGDQLRGYINDTLLITSTDANITTGSYCGIRSFTSVSTRKAYWDNFECGPLSNLA